MRKKKEDQFMKWLGITFMVIGGIAVLSAFPGIPLSAISIGILNITGINSLDATRLAVGAILFFLGLTAYNKK